MSDVTSDVTVVTGEVVSRETIDSEFFEKLDRMCDELAQELAESHEVLYRVGRSHDHVLDTINNTSLGEDQCFIGHLLSFVNDNEGYPFSEKFSQRLKGFSVNLKGIGANCTGSGLFYVSFCVTVSPA